MTCRQAIVNHAIHENTPDVATLADYAIVPVPLILCALNTTPATNAQLTVRTFTANPHDDNNIRYYEVASLYVGYDSRRIGRHGFVDVDSVAFVQAIGHVQRGRIRQRRHRQGCCRSHIALRQRLFCRGTWRHYNAVELFEEWLRTFSARDAGRAHRCSGTSGVLRRSGCPSDNFRRGSLSLDTAVSQSTDC